MCFGNSIRQKILLGIVCSLLALGVLGALVCYDLAEINRLIGVVESVDSLRSDVLEVRRYEKNILLFGSREEDQAELRRYATQAIKRGESILQLHNVPGGGTGSLPEFLAMLREYLAFAMDKTEGEGREELLTSKGQELTKNMQSIVRNLRQRILDIVSSLRMQMLAALGILLTVGGVLAWRLGCRILEALGLMEQATASVAQGRMPPAPSASMEQEPRHVLEAISHMARELEQRQNQLLQEKKLASLGVLTSGIAHQLNNPLNNISTTCQLLNEDLDAIIATHPESEQLADVKEQIDIVLQETDRSRDIVRGLLDFSRQSDFSLTPVQLKRIVERAVSLVASEVPSRVSLHVDVPDSIMLPLDVQQMQEVFINLFLNAFQAIDHYPGLVELIARIEPRRNMVRIICRDTGHGIPQNQLGRIFDPFFTLKPVGQGTGLGLSVVFGIIRKHGGTITACSEEKVGTSFVILLPLHNQQLTQIAVSSGGGPAPARADKNTEAS